MKRVVNGVSYNTETALRLGFDPQADAGPTTLYQTKGGAFFLHFEMTTGVWNEVSQSNEIVNEPVFRPIGPDHAREWLLAKGVEVFLNPFANDASGKREPGGTLAVRVPATLKRAVEQAAHDEGISGNAWTMRCLERGVRDGEMTRLLGTIAATFRYLTVHGDEFQDSDRIRIYRATMNEIDAGWRRRFPNVPIDQMLAHIKDQWDEELDSHVTGEPLI